jgi:isochorismate hydrolase
MFLHQNNKLLLVHDKRFFVSHWPPASEIGMLLITNFLELRVVAEIS